MPIPESQLEAWSHQGATVSAKRTHESIRVALDKYDGWPDGIRYDVYLQGSYKNSTNIHGLSDVDIVVQLDSIFYSNLSKEQKLRFGFIGASSTYGWSEFRDDCFSALRKYYGSGKVEEGRKSIKVQTPHLRADVVPCVQYRRYRSNPQSADDYVEGMRFWVQEEHRWVINYPKIHYANGVDKNSSTEGRYKHMVRIFKNAKSFLVGKETIPPDLAPSYFLECLLYNVPNRKFTGSLQEGFFNILNWLVDADLDELTCQNEQLPLFGDSPEQWEAVKATKFIHSMCQLWKNWK